MANPSRRGQVAGPVSNQMRGDADTPNANTSFILPYGLQLRQKVGMVNITNVVDAGATVVYTADNNFSAGNIVSIYYVNPVAYNLQNATILSATSTTFTITTTATGTYVSGGVAQRIGEIPVTVPTGVTFVYAIIVGGGGAGTGFGGAGAGAGAGGVAWGWTSISPICVIGAGGTTGYGNYSRYGNLIAGGGAPQSNPGQLGGGGGGSAYNQNSGGGATNYWGIPGGAGLALGLAIKGFNGSGAGGGSSATSQLTGGAGGDGISGGGGGQCVSGLSGSAGGNGGNGLVGGGGGCVFNSSVGYKGGDGGNGINVLTGAITLGGAGAGVTLYNTAAGGGGGGVAGNGNPGGAGAGVGGNGGNGGLGGLGGGGGGGQATGLSSPGVGGAGILYLFY